jgi:hypothetical protein
MKKQSEHSMTKLADAAFRQAAEKVIQRAENSGTPVIVWLNGKVTELDPRLARVALKNKRRRASS